ncbi:MAG: hypothetical protein SPJ62_12610 [Inconstantimicrobium porci]|uniref:hypothetical protein n=1 Tax=Inconstantimicrobium porci TaxID=2652291 RepID=UPI002A91947B|nr:hypothetical protein [Inconstantimicrobium porci]MDY5912813.1 hypothetical protein [Inconstantimicrobium porci]
MNIKYKGALGDLIASIGFILVSVLFLWVVLTSSFTTQRAVIYTVVAIISAVIGIRFIFIYRCCVRITDKKIIITEIIKSTSINIDNIESIYEEKNKLSIFTKDNLRIKFELKDLRLSDREEFISFLEKSCSK